MIARELAGSVSSTNSARAGKLCCPVPLRVCPEVADFSSIFDMSSCRLFLLRLPSLRGLMNTLYRTRCRITIGIESDSPLGKPPRVEGLLGRWVDCLCEFERESRRCT